MRRMKWLAFSGFLAISVGTACFAQDRPLPRTGAAATASAANESTKPATDADLVTSAPADNVDITVYGSAFAQVEETRTVTLKAGHNKIQLNGIAAKYRPDSLQVKGKGPGQFAYRTATYQPANLTPERLLADCVGKQIKARRLSDNSVVQGTLQNVSNGLLVLSTGDQTTDIVPANEVTLLETPTGLSNTPSLVVEADVTAAGDYKVNLIYDTDGITWSARHVIVLDEANSKLSSWEAAVSLQNDSGTTFRNATLRLLSGKVAAAADGPGGMYAPQAAMRSAGFNAESADAAVETVGDQKTYTLPGTVDLAAGQSRSVTLFKGENVPVKRAYVVGQANRYYNNNAKQDAQIRLTVENCDKHNLGKPIPAGLVKVYQYNSANKLQLTGSTRVGDKTQNEIFDLNVGTSSDIKWEMKLAKAEPVVDLSHDTPGTTQPRPGAPTPPARVIQQPATVRTAPQGATANGDEAQFEDRTYEIVVYNYKTDTDVTVKVEVAVPAKQQLEPKWTRPRADQATTDLNVPKNGKTSVQYTIRTQVR